MAIADLVTNFSGKFNTYTPVVNLLEDSGSSTTPVNQLGTGQSGHIKPGNVQGTATNADVDQVVEDIATIDVEFATRLGVEVAVTGQNLDRFIVQIRFHASGSYADIAAVGSDFTTPAGLVIDASGDITTQASGSSGWFVLDVHGVESVLLRAACAVDNGATTVYWSAN